MRIIDRKILLYKKALKSGLGGDVAYLKRRLRQMKKEAKNRKKISIDWKLYFQGVV